MPIVLKALPISCVAHFLAIVSVILMLIWCIVFRGGFAWYSDTNPDMVFNLHPVLMLTGLIIIGGEAIMCHKCLPLRKPWKKLIHLTLHALAFVLGVMGIYVAFKFHTITDTAHFRTFHSLMGYCFILLYGIQWVYGFVVFFFPRGGAWLRRQTLPLHIAFGMSMYIAVLAVAEFGYLEKLTLLQIDGLGEYSPEALLVNGIGVVTCFFGAFVLLTTCCQPVVQEEEEEEE